MLPAIWIRTFSRLTSISISGIMSSLLLTTGLLNFYYSMLEMNVKSSFVYVQVSERLIHFKSWLVLVFGFVWKLELVANAESSQWNYMLVVGILEF